MATKGNSRGRYVTKVGFYDIYAKDSYRPKKDGSKKYDKPEVSGSEFNIYHSKKLVQKGLKFKNDAINKAKELLGKEYRQVYNLV
jgi:hypothetical protein